MCSTSQHWAPMPDPTTAEGTVALRAPPEVLEALALTRQRSGADELVPLGCHEVGPRRGEGLERLSVDGHVAPLDRGELGNRTQRRWSADDADGQLPEGDTEVRDERLLLPIRQVVGKKKALACRRRGARTV